MYQAGIKNITFYENKGIAFRYFDPLNLNAITNISSLGNVIAIDNIQQPSFDIKLKFSPGGNVLQDFSLDFLILGLTLESYNTLNQLKTSIYGWCFMVEFYDGSFKFYNIPVYCRESDIKPQIEMSFAIKMQTPVPTKIKYLDYIPGAFVGTVYRFDSEILTWDSEIISWDYEL